MNYSKCVDADVSVNNRRTEQCGGDQLFSYLKKNNNTKK